MPTEIEFIVTNGCWSLSNLIDQLAELYRDNPEAASFIRADADMIEEAYRRLGNFVHHIRPQKAVA